MGPFSSLPMLLLGTFLVTLLSSTSLGFVRRFHYDAELFETNEPDSPSILFTRTNKDHWKNLTSLSIKNGFSTFDQVCTFGGGSWILYPDPDYLIDSHHNYVFVSGEHCFSTQYIHSMQPLGEIHEPLDKGLVVFPQDYFQGPGKTVVNGSYSGPVGSFVYAGGSPYTIGSGSDAVCLVPAYWAQHISPCLIPTLDSSFGLKSVNSIKEGCDPAAKLRTFSPQNCKNEGVHLLFADKDFSYKKMNGACGGKADADLKGKLGQVMDIWKARVSNGLETLESIKIPYEALYKARVVDGIVETFHRTCPTVPSEYLNILKAVFLTHLRTAWKRYPEAVGVEDDYWRHTGMFLDSCSSHVMDVGLGNQDVSCTPPDLDGDGPDTVAIKELMTSRGYDTVIEQMYLIMNQVTPYCNHLNGYKTNDWTNMASVFRRSFFDPISTQWYQPGSWGSIYPIIFSGFDMTHQYERISACVVHALEKTPSFDAIGRTRFFMRKDSEDYEKYSELLRNELEAVNSGYEKAEKKSSKSKGRSSKKGGR